MAENQSSAPGWGELVRGANAARSATIAGGMITHALNTFVVVTILPTIVHDIGGLRFFAWNTTLYVVASLFAAACCARLLTRVGARWVYRGSLLTFALGGVLCALAPTMPVFLLGRALQGLGAGTLSALSFVMVRALFPAPMWPRGMTVISTAWGVATLLGPALGGVFAQVTGWRVGFWLLFLMAPCLLVLVEASLPRDLARPPAPRTRLAAFNLVLLAASVLCVSAGGMTGDVGPGVAALALAFAGFAWFARRESGTGARLLPVGACNPATPLGAAYGALALLLIGVNTEIFVPYFLQTLHGLAPLQAGYLSATMAGGWTIASMVTSGATQRQTNTALAGGPVLLAGGLLTLTLLMPMQRDDAATIVAIGAALISLGAGIGLCWPHLAAKIFTYAADGEKDLAASSITVIVMVSNAFGSALGGLVTNTAGMIVPGGGAGAASASAWLFGLYIAAPLLALLVTRKLRAVALPGVAAPAASPP
jgi:predicted MFS family arabinose efflux permease